ncbi:glycosyltransferase domain-containing protein [Variovorax sp. LARHSF232]
MNQSPPPNEPTVCVYTVMMGDYEPLNEQSVSRQSAIPFICLTDNPNLKSETWQVVQVSAAFSMDPIRSQRLLKICPHMLPSLDAYHRSLYIDNSVILKQAPESIISKYGWSSGLSVPTHSFRDSVMDEFIEVARVGFDDQSRIFEQLNHYLSYGESTLEERPYWTGVLLRDHLNPTVRRVMDFWALHVMRYSRRDQLSFNLAVREVGLPVERWEIDTFESWFHRWPHTPGRKVMGGVRNPLVSATPPSAQIRQLQKEAAASQAQSSDHKSEIELLKREVEGMTTSLVVRVEAQAQLIKDHALAIERTTQQYTATVDSLEECNAALARREIDLERAEDEATELRSRLEVARQETETTLARMHASTSWRMTAPLRWIRDLVR